MVIEKAVISYTDAVLEVQVDEGGMTVTRVGPEGGSVFLLGEELLELVELAKLMNLEGFDE